MRSKNFVSLTYKLFSIYVAKLACFSLITALTDIKFSL